MNSELRITHTANAGVLISIGRNGLGVDIFSKDAEALYPDTPEELKQELLGKIEQRSIQTLLFTHGHDDHFCLEDVLEALRRNPDLTVISTEEVVQKVRREEAQAGNLLAVSAVETDTRRIDIPGFSLELFNSRHMGAQYAGVQNLVVLLTAGGKKVFLPGDAWPEPELFERTAKWSREIDVMIAPFPLIGLPTTRRMIDRTLELRNILAVHLPRPQADAEGWLASAKAVCGRAKDGLPMPLFGELLGREYYF